MNPEKLAKLQASAAAVRIGGKGTPRRKVKKVTKHAAVDDKKIQATLKKINVQNIPMIEEVNMFKEDGSVIHIQRPHVQASVASNTFAISGRAEDKQLTELMPGIISQMGADNLNQLRRLAESMGVNGSAGAAPSADDDDVPDLVESFENAASLD